MARRHDVTNFGVKFFVASLRVHRVQPLHGSTAIHQADAFVAARASAWPVVSVEFHANQPAVPPPVSSMATRMATRSLRFFLGAVSATVLIARPPQTFSERTAPTARLGWP